jgi:hypothetical protein
MVKNKRSTKFINFRYLRNLSYDKILDHIDNLATLDSTSEYIIFNKNLPNKFNLKNILLLLKYKFNYIPTIEKLFTYNKRWIPIFLKYLNIENNPTLLLNTIQKMEFTTKSIKALYKICSSIYTRNINFSPVLNYLIDKSQEYRELTNIINTILTRANYDVSEYLDFFIISSNKKNIKFSTQKQLFDYIDRNKYVSSKLLNLNKHLFNDKELYDFLNNKPCICNIYNYVIANKSVYSSKLFAFVYMFTGKTLIKLMKYLNKHSDLYKGHDIIYKIEPGLNKCQLSINYKLFCILSILDNTYYNNGYTGHYGYLYKTGDFNTYCTLDSVINTFTKYISNTWSEIIIDINNMNRISHDIIHDLKTVFKFCIYIAAKKSSNEEIYNSLEKLINILDTNYQYKFNPTFKLLQEMLQILVDYL